MFLKFIVQRKSVLALISSFSQIMKKTLPHISSLLQMDLARASLELIRVLRTFTGSIAKNLHKL